MTYLMHFQHGSRLSWNRDFLKLNDQKGDVSSIRLNLLQRILRITLGSLASLIGINAFYASTILSQKRITPFEQTTKSAVALNIETLVCALNVFGKKLTFQAPLLNPLEHALASKNAEDNKVQQDDAKDLYKITRYFSEDNPHIPKDVAGLILSWLEFKDVVRMKQVNRAWHQLISQITNSLKKQFVDSCYSEATKALVDAPAIGENQGVISTQLRILLGSIVQHDIKLTKITVMLAKQKALELTDDFKNSLLNAIVKVEAEYDLEAAKQTAATITADFERNMAIFHITLYIEKNLPRAKELALEEDVMRDYLFEKIVIEEAKIDIAAALETLLSIRRPFNQNQTKIKIIGILAFKTDVHAAQRLTSELEDPSFRYQAEMAIALLEPQPNFQPVIATALTIVNDDNEQERALARIAIAQNKFDRNAAQKTLSLIEIPSQRSIVIAELTCQEVKKDMSKAIRFLLKAQKNHKLYYKLVLLKHTAKRNMWEAKTLAHSIQDLGDRVSALQKLAEFAIKRNKVTQANPLPLQNRDAPR